MAGPNLPETIAQHLRRAILRGALAPGAPIKERDHAAEMGVSRTPMREAIRILAKEELVELRPSRSPVVANPSAKELYDQGQVLIALERLSGELACRHATAAGLAAVAAAATRMEESFPEAGRIESFERDMAFHSAIAEASQNASLARTHRAYLARLWRARFLASRKRANRDRALEQHAAILAALLARDVAAFRAALGAHLDHLPDDLAEIATDAPASGRGGAAPEEADRGRAAPPGGAVPRGRRA
ncbi:GntR family transcriptional regulator [Roseivivax sp. CAU 1761]